MERFDILILGAGPAGYVAAIRAAQLKKKVCVIEKDKVGGTCLNNGCIPTKSAIASANLYRQIKRAPEFGISVGDVCVDFASVQERKRKIVDTGINGIKSLFKKHGITLEYGIAKFAPIFDSESKPFLIESCKENNCRKLINGDKIIIATGSCPADIHGVHTDDKYIFNSDSILDIKSLPVSLTIIGGGPVGCEFAHIFSSFGVRVSIVEQMSHIVPLEDEDISSILEREFKKREIKIILNNRIEKVSKEDGQVKATLSDGIEIKSEKLLVATGRKFNSTGFGIESMDIKRGEKGNILVNDRMESSAPGVYAAGDVAGRAMLAYVASKEGIVAADNAAGIEKKMDYSLIPSVVFAVPEIGSVGLKEKEAREKGIEVNIGTFQFRTLGKAHASGEISGMVKILSECNTDKVLGVHIVGEHASEMIHEAVVAIKMGMKSKELEDTIHAHPVYSEGLMECAADVHGRAIHKI